MISKILRCQFRTVSSTNKLNQNPRFMITGGRGQLGRGIADELRNRYDNNCVLLTDISDDPTPEDVEKGYTQHLCVLDYENYEKSIKEFKPTWILHLPALLSASCESNLDLAWEININSVRTAWKLAELNKSKLFIPSSIGAFGPNSPLEHVPNKCIQDPTSFYGVGKVMVENLVNYSRNQHGFDFRCLRYPGIISPIAEPGGGTTDYAVDIFHQIIGADKNEFSSFLAPNARLPMMLESDCINATCDFLDTPSSELDKVPKQTGTYNVSGCSFTPEEIANEIMKYKKFDMKYDIDEARQGIAESWPRIFDATDIYNDLGIKSKYDTIEKLTKFMVENVPKKTE